MEEADTIGYPDLGFHGKLHTEQTEAWIGFRGSDVERSERTCKSGDVRQWRLGH